MSTTLEASPPTTVGVDVVTLLNLTPLDLLVEGANGQRWPLGPHDKARSQRPADSKFVVIHRGIRLAELRVDSGATELRIEPHRLASAVPPFEVRLDHGPTLKVTAPLPAFGSLLNRANVPVDVFWVDPSGTLEGAGLRVISRDLRVISWGDGTGVPMSGKNLVLVGTDRDKRLRIRVFDASGNRVADTDELKMQDLRVINFADDAQVPKAGGMPKSGMDRFFVGTDQSGQLQIRIFDGNGSLLTNTNETRLGTTPSGLIRTLAQRIPQLLPPHALTDAEKVQILGEVETIFSEVAVKFHLAPRQTRPAMIWNLKQKLPKLLPPNAPTDAAKKQILEEVTSIFGSIPGREVKQLTLEPDSGLVHSAWPQAYVAGNQGVLFVARCAVTHDPLGMLLLAQGEQHLTITGDFRGRLAASKPDATGLTGVGEVTVVNRTPLEFDLEDGAGGRWHLRPGEQVKVPRPPASTFAVKARGIRVAAPTLGESARWGCDLRLTSSLTDVDDIPTPGQSLLIVAQVENVLHFRILDQDGRRVVDTDETKLTAQAGRIQGLREQLEGLWPPHELTETETTRVIAAVTAIVDHPQIAARLDIVPDMFFSAKPTPEGKHPKFQFSPVYGTECEQCELSLVSSLNDVNGIPTAGQDLIVVAAVKDALYLRIFDRNGRRVVDTDETKRRAQAEQFRGLGEQLEGLWPPHRLTGDEKARVIAAVTAIVDHSDGIYSSAELLYTGQQAAITLRNGAGEDVEVFRLDGSGNKEKLRSLGPDSSRDHLLPASHYLLPVSPGEVVVAHGASTGAVLAMLAFRFGDKELEIPPAVVPLVRVANLTPLAFVLADGAGGGWHLRPNERVKVKRPRDSKFLVKSVERWLTLGELKLDSSATDWKVVPGMLRSPARPDLQLISWGDGSGVPASGNNLIIVGADGSGLLHVRAFDAAGHRVTDVDEPALSSSQAGAIADLKMRLPDLLPPHVLTGAEKVRVLAEVASIVDPTPPARTVFVNKTGVKVDVFWVSPAGKEIRALTLDADPNPYVRRSVSGKEGDLYVARRAATGDLLDMFVLKGVRALWLTGGPELKLVSWGDGSGVPEEGHNLVVVGIDTRGLLHARVFDAHGTRVTEMNEASLPPTQAGATSALKRRLRDVLPPAVPTGDEKARILGDVWAFLSRTAGDDRDRVEEVVPRPAYDLLEADHPLPDPRDVKYVRHCAQDLGLAELNGWERPVRRVTITGVELVLDTDDRYSLIKEYCNKEDLQEVHILADTVVVRTGLRFPQADVSVFARELRFEGSDAFIDTRPLDSDYRDPDKIDGKNGARGGDINLFVGVLTPDINQGPHAPRALRATGAKGQDPDEGGYEVSTDLRNLSPITAADWDRVFSYSHRKLVHEMASDPGSVNMESTMDYPSWEGGGCAGLELLSAENVSSIPTTGKDRVIVATVKGVLHFRIFDGAGKEAVNSDETKMASQAGQIERLRKLLASPPKGLWPPHQLTDAEKGQIVYAVTSLFARASWDAFMKGYRDKIVYVELTNRYYQSSLHTHISQDKTIDTAGLKERPGKGGDAKRPGTPGTGGAGGTVRSNRPLPPTACDVSGGRSGARHPGVKGGAGGTPSPAFWVFFTGWPDGDHHRVDQRVESYEAEQGQGSGPGPEARNPNGLAGAVVTLSGKDDA